MDADTPEPRRPLPEQTFFADPGLDRAFGVVMALATEVYVLRDRLRALERLLERNQVIDGLTLDRQADDGDRRADDADRQEFVASLLEPLLGQQASKGAS